MRRSPLRHPVAVLRTTLGLTQTELGELTGRAARTIQSVELGTLPLSGDLALSIAEATGIDAGWLLEGDPDAPPRKGLTARHAAPSPGPYTRDDYETHRALMESPVASVAEAEAELERVAKIPKKGPGMDTAGIAMPTAKRALLAAKRQIVQEADAQTLGALKRLLNQTVLTRTGDLLRWKLRQFLRTLAEENGVKIELPTGIRATFSHVYQADAAHPKAAQPARKPARKR
jgi:transcriptional regulator with XRE-family HTH domain